jgi:hypothetical protein
MKIDGDASPWIDRLGGEERIVGRIRHGRAKRRRSRSLPAIWDRLLEEKRRGELRDDVRRILALRKLRVSSADDARINSCRDLATLELWLDQATTATSVAEALRIDAGGVAGNDPPPGGSGRRRGS